MLAPLAFRDFEFLGRRPFSNTSTDCSPSCLSHAVISWGCTSKRCANSAIVLPPATAASATFTLNVAERSRLMLFLPFPAPRKSLSGHQKGADYPFIGLFKFPGPLLITTILTEEGQRVLTFPVSGMVVFGNPEYQQQRGQIFL